MIPNLDEAGAMLQVYNKGDFHLLHGEVVAGITAYFARKSDPENEEYWAAAGMQQILDAMKSLVDTLHI